eukprot:2279649-Ditylum_brightwellii.AAC.1
MDDPNRGFSFRKNGPLDMRFDASRTNTYTARAIVNGWTAQKLEELFRRNDEPLARVIAQEIVKWRDRNDGHEQNKNRGKGNIKTTAELRHVVDTAIESFHQQQQAQKEEKDGDTKKASTKSTSRRSNPHLIWRPDEKRNKFVSKLDRRRILARFVETKPKHSQVLTRVFQALRMEVNREVHHITTFFKKVGKHLKDNGGRLVVISFHPMEDRLIDEAMRQMCLSSSAFSAEGRNNNNEAVFELMTIDPLRPSREEIKMNRRA